MARSFEKSTDQLLADIEASRLLAEAWVNLSPEEINKMRVNANHLLIYGSDANAAKQAGSDVLVLLELLNTMDLVVDAVTHACPGHYTAHWEKGKLKSLEFSPDPPERDLLLEKIE